VVRELEAELDALAGFEENQQKLSELLQQKVELENSQNKTRLSIEKLKHAKGDKKEIKELRKEFEKFKREIIELDGKISPLAKKHSELMNDRWGLVMRSGNDKSHMARQIEKNADIYMSRVSNFSFLTPYAYMRSPRSSLPHDSLEY